MSLFHANIGRSFQFLPYVLIGTFLIVATFAGLFLAFGKYSNEDVVSYRETMAKAAGKGSVERTVSSQHFRQNLQKDVFLTRGGGVYQFRLKSGDAELALERIKGKVDIVETMDDVRCWLQEEFLYRFPNGSMISSQDQFWSALAPVAVVAKAVPMQRNVYLEAKRATYDYDSERFVADDAKIWRYIVPGHHLEETVNKKSALISGTAEHVVISFGSQGLLFKADGFKAEISLKGVSR